MLLLIFFQLSLAKLSTPQGFISPVLLESNSLNRDESLIPDSINDSGPDYNKGDTYFVLVTTFIEDQPGSGKLWVVPTDLKMREYSYELIIGLNRPTGVCFDKNHRFLYIVDNGFVGNGFIYQYEIDWKTDELFVLARNVYVVVYEGVDPYDCKVDEYGNLYFLEAEYDTINMISYLDLYSGFTNMNYTIYQSVIFIISLCCFTLSFKFLNSCILCLASSDITLTDLIFLNFSFSTSSIFSSKGALSALSCLFLKTSKACGTKLKANGLHIKNSKI